MNQKLKVGLVGLGRMGKEYARFLHSDVSLAELSGVCSLSKDELNWAHQEIGIQKLYFDYDEMLKNKELDAIFIVSPTDLHVEHIINALKADKHVFCEKPLTTSIEDCRTIENCISDYPHLKTMIGFVRRFDASYIYAKEKIDEGLIGQPFLVKSQTVDKDLISDFQVERLTQSGGIFHDYNVHDIDLARWLLSSEMKSVYAIGGAFKYPVFKEKGDADNVLTTCHFENGSMAVIGASRTAAHGHDTYTEVVGTQGTLRIGRPSNKNRVEIYDSLGMRQESVETFWDRFEDAFLRMTKEFINLVINDLKTEMTVQNAVKNTEAARAFTESYKTGEVVHV